MEVPRSCVGFIMGKFGMSLREVEFEFNTLMVRQRSFLPPFALLAYSMARCDPLGVLCSEVDSFWAVMSDMGLVANSGRMHVWPRSVFRSRGSSPPFPT